MPAEEISPQQRLYGAMQMLVRYCANAEPLPEAEPRGVVGREDAQDALFQLAAVIDEAAQAGGIERERAFWAGAMVMLIQECVQPLPPTGGPDGQDLYGEDLQTIVDALRQVHAPGFVPPDL